MRLGIIRADRAARSLVRVLHDADLAVFRRVARIRSPLLDRTLPPLGRLANRSLLWMIVSAGLAVSGKRWARRGALRGMLSVALTSAIVNLPAKLLARRARPEIGLVPQGRRLLRVPRSSSFPSGHSASAFAFATGAGLELPSARAGLAAAAMGVAASRVYTGAHYPADVAAGAAMGTAIALATRKIWPLAPNDPPALRPVLTPAQAEPSPAGAGLTIVINPSAGPEGEVDLAKRLRDALPDAVVIDLEETEDLRSRLVDAAKDALALGVAGGDGSVNCAAEVAHEINRPLVVFPAGTLNHLAHALGIESIDDSVAAVRRGNAVAVDVATIDGRFFLNTASFGSYPELVDARVRLEDRIGKWPALLVALVRVLRKGRPVGVELDGRRARIWLAFVGNCRYQPDGFAPGWRERLDDGKLDIRVVDGTSPFARTRLILSMLAGRLANSPVHRQWQARELRIRSLEGPLRLARDGETFDAPEEVVLSKHPKPLIVYAASTND